MNEDEARQRLVRSMVPEKVCRTCGLPSRRIVEVELFAAGKPRQAATGTYVGRRAVGTRPGGGERIIYDSETTTATPHFDRKATTTGFTDCGHDDWRPGVWLDPFAAIEQ